MKRTLFLFIITAICISSCKKDYPNPTSESPVFGFNGTVNNASVTIQAGLNNYYMYSFFTQDSNAVYNFLGELKQNNCTNCNNKIKIQINDNAVSAVGGTSHINSSIAPGNYSYLASDTSQLTVSFTAPNSGSVQFTYLWNFGDNTTSNLANPIHTFAQAGTYTVCLTITDNSACTSSICNSIDVGTANSYCTTSFTDTLLGGAIGNCLFLANGNPASNYLWDFGDSTSFGPSSSDSVTHMYNAVGIYRVCLTTTSAAPGSCTSTYCRNVATHNVSGCYSNFDFSIQSSNPNPLSLSDVIVSWTNSSGITYTSKAVIQPSSSYFQVLSVDNYLNNERNEPTKKLHVKFKCVLSDGLNSITVNDGDAVIAVSYR